MFRKGAFTVVLVMLLILGLAASASANPGKGNNKGWKFKAKNNWKAVELTDISSHWAEQPIRHMCSIGLISGYPDKRYIPNAPVSKYEALMMICRAAGFDPDADSSWEQKCEDCLEFALDEGIIDDDDFAGWKPAKRYEVAVWSIRAMGLDEDGGDLSFRDIDDIPADAWPYIGVMFKHKYMVGYPGNFFQPNKPVTRAEMAKILYLMMSDWPDYYDDGDLRLSSLAPRDGEDNVDPDTNVLTARFNMDIEAADDLEDVKDGIRVKNVTDNDYADIDSVSIDGNKLTIEMEDSLEEDCLYRVTIKKDIIESEDGDESFGGISGSEWEFSTFDGSEINLTNLDPDDGDENVDPDTDTLVAVFNMDIQAVNDLRDVEEGIEVKNVTDGDYVDIYSVSINDNRLTIKLDDPLEDDCLYRVTVEEDIIESEDSVWNFEGISSGEWEFSTFDGGELDVESLDPEDGEDNADPGTRVLRAEFNNAISAVSGKSLLSAVRVYNVDRDRYEDIDKVEIDDDTLIITLDDELGAGDTFEVTIRPGYLEDDDSGEDYGGLAGDKWRFTTD